MAEDKNTKEMKDKEQFDLKKELIDWAEAVLFSFFIAVTLFTYILKPAIVDGTSMLPTLENKERLITTNLFYTPKQGDIVTVDWEGGNESIVKRIIATEGQEININFDEGKVYVDGEELIEPYINEITQRDLGGFSYPITIPEGKYFVMGDNRNNSMDSRDARIGFIDRKDIWGKVIFRISPFDRFGTVK